MTTSSLSGRGIAWALSGVFALAAGSSVFALPPESDAWHVEAQIARIEPVAAKNRQVAEFNEAVELANLGDWKGAGSLCDALLATPLEADLRPRVEDLQKRANGALGNRKK